MNFEKQTALAVSQVEAEVSALERVVTDYEQAIVRIEQDMDEIERLEKAEPAGDEAWLQPVAQALQSGQRVAELVHAANLGLENAVLQAEAFARPGAPLENDGPLPDGTLICDERYRLIHLLHRRSRIHLYLARRVEGSSAASAHTQPLVAVREIVLAGLAPEARRGVVRGAFEEFAAPRLFGSPHLPGVGDHIYIENERHYLIMQPRPVRGSSPIFAQPLSECLPDQPGAHPDLSVALHLGIQLCYVVARLHSMKTILGELTPAMVLVSRAGTADWSPLLLASWPPAPQFWHGQDEQEALKLCARLFPPVDLAVRSVQSSDSPADSGRAFVAPEILEGTCDARSDIYALGAILYLLLTGSPPTAAMPQSLHARQANEDTHRGGRRAPRKGNLRRVRTGQQEIRQDPVLTPPRLLNKQISPLLEQILLRALAPNPEQRFTSALDLAEALEGTRLNADVQMPQAKISRLRRLLEWLKQ